MSKKRAPLLVGLAMLALCIPGCSISSDESSVLLRYSPEVGAEYLYQFEVPGLMELTTGMEVLSREDGWYRVGFSVPLFGEMRPGGMEISDRHNTDNPGYITLNFPDQPVAPGDEWQGQVPWYFEHYYVLDETPITVPASYKLLEIKQGEKGRYAVIERTIDVDVVVDGLEFYVGQLGVRWEDEGVITEVFEEYDAFGKLMVGDVVVGINGRDAKTEQDRSLLAEEHIQHPKGSSVVEMAVLRDGEELTVGVEKSIDELALLRAENMYSVLHVNFDVERGILLSAEVSLSEDIVFSSPTGDPISIVDSYGGFSKFGYLHGETTCRESYGGSGLAWRLTLEE
jgi:hypothetical protein